MDQSLPPPDDEVTIRALLDDADNALFGFLHLIRLRIDGSRPGLLSRKLIALILRTLLIPAESLLRRSLYALTALVAPPAPRTPPTHNALAPKSQPSATTRTRAPVFRLTEPAPRSASPSPRTAEKLPASTRQPANPEQIEARFLRRLEAFERAMHDPLRNVRRLQRRLAAARRKPVRPLHPGLPPGLVNSRDTYLKFVFEQMNTFAGRTIAQACDTS
jgi:hypothetical protein